MSMLSGSGLDQRSGRRRRPVATTILILLMMGVLFGATYFGIRLLRGDSQATQAGGSPTPAPCVTTTVQPGLALPKPATVTVNVFNATDRGGLARTTANELGKRGFGIGSIANDPLGADVAGVGEVRHGPDGLAGAQLMLYYVPGAVLVADTRTGTTVDLVLGEKFIRVAPQKTVDAALAKPVPVASGAGCVTPGASASPNGSPSASPTG
jgi:hypothetical protein